MFKRLENYHSHIYLCGHAGGTPIEYLEEAIKKGYRAYGISDHAPMPNLDKSSRMAMSDYTLYLKLMDEAREFANKNNIIFYQGLEIEYFNNMDYIYKKYLKDLNYLILGQHYIELKDGSLKSTYALSSIDDLLIYRDTLIKALKTGYFNLLCHPDLCFYNIKNPTKEIYETLRPVVKLAKDLDIPIELNANGIRRSKYEENNLDYNNFRYPRIDFFKIVQEEGAKVIITSDCHSVKDMDDWATDEAIVYAKKLNLNLINDLKMK